MIKLLFIIYMIIGILIAKYAVSDKITDNNTEQQDAMICIVMLCITVFWPLFLIYMLFKLVKKLK